MKKTIISALCAILGAAAGAAQRELFLNNIYTGNVRRATDAATGERYWEATVQLEFTDESGTAVKIKAADLPENCITVSPAVKDFRMNRRTAIDEIHVSGRFLLGTNYLFTAKAGITDAEGRTLMRDARLSHIVEKDIANDLTFACRKSYLPLKSAKLELPYTVTGKGKYTYVLRKCYKNSFGASYFGAHMDYAAEIGRIERVEVDETEDGKAKMLNLEEFPGFRREPGFYTIRCSGKGLNSDEYAYGDTAVVFITDIAVQTVESPDDDVWAVAATRISDGTPVEGAKITIVTQNNQYLPLGVTGKDGTLKARKPFAAPSAGIKDESETRGVLAEAGDDLVYFVTEQSHSTADGKAYKRKLRSPAAFVHLDRGICRPGDTFTASALVRDADRKIMGSVPCTMTLTSPAGRKIGQKDLDTDSTGFATCEFSVPSDASTGTYSVKLAPRGAGKGGEWGAQSIMIAAYTPDKVKVELEVSKRPLHSGSAIHGAVSAAYYFGAPVPSATYNCKAVAFPWETEPPAVWDMKAPDGEWTAGDGTGWKYPANWRLVENGRKPLPASGKAEFEIPSFASLGGRAFRPFELYIEAEVSESGGRTVCASEERIVFPTDWFAAARVRNGALELRAVAAPGREARAADILGAADTPKTEVKFFKVEWNPHLEKDGRSYSRKWVRETVEMPQFAFTVDTASLKGAGISRSVAALPPGAYEAVATCGGDIRTRLEFWHSNGAPVARSANPSILKMTSDAPAYKPGAAAKLKLYSHCAATAFIACGERGIDRYFTAELAKGDNEITIDIPRSVQNGVYYAGVTVVARASARNRDRLFALAELKIDQTAHRLAAKIDAPKLARPGDTAAVKIRVTRPGGAPVSNAFVRVQMCDSGVLALTKFKTPDPFAFFWQGTGCQPFSFSDIFNSIYPELKILPDGRFGGGDDMPFNPDMLKEEPAVRVILAPVATGADGTAEMNFTVPEHLGALRIMAVVACEDAAGCGEAEMSVAKEYDMTMSAPRFAFPGDSFTATATVFNNTESPADYVLTLSGTGSIAPETAEPRTGTLAAGASALVKYSVKATDIVAGADSGFKMKLQIPAAGKTVEKTVAIKVRPSRPPVMQAFYTRVKPGGVFDSSAYAGKCIGSYTGECAVAASPAVALAPALKWLQDYRYGCLEQTASKALPFTAAAECARLGAIDPAVAETMAHNVDAAVLRVMRCSKGSDGFRMWPEPGCDWSWQAAELHAAAFLAEASRRPAGGDFRPEPVAPAVRKWLANVAGSSVVAANPGKNEPESAFRANRESRALAAWILARAGDTRGLNAARAILARERDSFAAFVAAAALATGGYASEGMPAAVRLLKSKVWRRHAYTDLFGGSSAARIGFVLTVVSEFPRDLADEAAQEMIPELLAERAPGPDVWGSTFANAWAAYGLAKYTALYAVQGAAAAGRKIPFKSGGAPAVFTNTTAEAQWVRTTLAGVPAERPQDALDLKIKREYVNTNKRDGGRIFHGDLVKVRIEVSGAAFQGRNLVLSDLVPAGFEIEDPALATRAGAGAFPKGKTADNVHNLRCEKIDDRCHFIFSRESGPKPAVFEYTIRACTRGCFKTGDATLEEMYNPRLRATAPGGDTLVVE